MADEPVKMWAELRNGWKAVHACWRQMTQGRLQRGPMHAR